VAEAHELPPNALRDERGLTRRDLFPLVGAAALAPFVAPQTAAGQQAEQHERDERDDDRDDERDDGRRAPSRVVYVGTYTTKAPGGVDPSTSEGIYVFNMNGRNGDLSLIQVV
jgi:hypothetical protein